MERIDAINEAKWAAAHLRGGATFVFEREGGYWWDFVTQREEGTVTYREFPGAPIPPIHAQLDAAGWTIENTGGRMLAYRFSQSIPETELLLLREDGELPSEIDDRVNISRGGELAQNRTVQEVLIGCCFLDQLAGELNEYNLRAIAFRNSVEPERDICHSHDFVDANVFMNRAALAFGCDVGAGAKLRAVKAWGNAWDFAKFLIESIYLPAAKREHDVDARGFESTLQELLGDALAEDPDYCRVTVQNFREADVLSSEAGLVIELPTGQQFQLTIVQINGDEDSEVR